MNFEGITINGQSVQGLGSTVVIDSGTNDLLISQSGFDAMEQMFKGMCSTTKLAGICGVDKTLFDGACFHMTEEEIAMFPDFTVSVTVRVPACRVAVAMPLCLVVARGAELCVCDTVASRTSTSR